jgi:stress-induced morphogen
MSCQLLATEGEMKITQLLKDKLNPSYVDVKDISGGCGAMYQITIDADIFKDKRMIQQHKMVNEV